MQKVVIVFVVLLLISSASVLAEESNENIFEKIIEAIFGEGEESRPMLAPEDPCPNRVQITPSTECTCDGAQYTSGYCCYYSVYPTENIVHQDTKCGYTEVSPHWEHITAHKFQYRYPLATTYNVPCSPRPDCYWDELDWWTKHYDIMVAGHEEFGDSEIVYLRERNPNMVVLRYYKDLLPRYEHFEIQELIDLENYCNSLPDCDFEELFLHFGEDTVLYFVEGISSDDDYDYGPYGTQIMPGWDDENDDAPVSGDGINDYYRTENTGVLAWNDPSSEVFSYTIEGSADFEKIWRVEISGNFWPNTNYYRNEILTDTYFDDKITIDNNVVTIQPDTVHFKVHDGESGFEVPIDVTIYYFEEIQEGAPNPNAHANTKEMSRAQGRLWKTWRYIYDVTEQPVKDFHANALYDIVQTEHTGGNYFDGIFVDEHAHGYIPGDINPVIFPTLFPEGGGGVYEYNNNYIFSDEFELSYGDDVRDYLTYVNSIMGDDGQGNDKLLLPNTCIDATDDTRDRAIAADGDVKEHRVDIDRNRNLDYRLIELFSWMHEVYDAGKTIIWTTESEDVDDYFTKNCVGIITPPSGYTAGIYGSAEERSQMTQLAFYYLVHKPSQSAFGILPMYWDCAFEIYWNYAQEVDIGQPIGDEYVYYVADGPQQEYDIYVYARDYENALVLFRNCDSEGCSYGGGDTLLDLGGTYQILQDDGNLGNEIDQITLKNVEGVILMNSGPQLNFPTISNIECNVGTGYAPCQNIQYGDTLNAVKATCTDSDGDVTGVDFSLTNLDDGFPFFVNLPAIENLPDEWELTGLDVEILDSGDFDLDVSCTDNDVQTTDEKESFFIPWGILNVEVVDVQ